MKVFKFFFALLFISLFAVYSCSEDGTMTEHQTAVNTKSLKPDEFKFAFDIRDYKEHHAYGYSSIDEDNVVLFDMDIKDGISYSNIEKIDDNNVRIENYNGNESIINIITSPGPQLDGKPTTLVTYDIDGEYSYQTSVGGTVIADDIIGEQDLISDPPKDQPVVMACPPCLVIVVAIIVGGAYCAYKHNQASNNCLAAYKQCVDGGSVCSYNFESKTCGGTCSIVSVGAVSPASHSYKP